MRRLTVAAVQMECAAGRVDANLAKAGRLVEQAAAEGARLVLLPELMPGGYRMTEEIWDTAEPPGGRAQQWLCGTARRLGIFLGCSLLEAEGEDFFNSFYLARPDGTMAGRVRKSPPAAVEAYFYRSGDDPHVIETELGRIGVGICYENMLARQVCELFDAKVDLVLQPLSAAAPMASFPLTGHDAGEGFDDLLRRLPAAHAAALGVPVVMANTWGAFRSPLPKPFPDQVSRFPGLSRIVDAAGEVRAAMAAGEGCVVAEVELDPARRTTARPRTYGRWCLRVPWYSALYRLSQWAGERSYRRNPRRAAKAMAASPH